VSSPGGNKCASGKNSGVGERVKEKEVFRSSWRPRGEGRSMQKTEEGQRKRDGKRETGRGKMKEESPGKRGTRLKDATITRTSSQISQGRRKRGMELQNRSSMGRKRKKRRHSSSIGKDP